MLRHYYAIAKRRSPTWMVGFPGREGVVFATDDAAEIVPHAQDVLAWPLMGLSAGLPRSIEEGAKPPDLSDYEAPVMVVVIPFEAEAEAREAA